MLILNQIPVFPANAAVQSKPLVKVPKITAKKNVKKTIKKATPLKPVKKPAAKPLTVSQVTYDSSVIINNLPLSEYNKLLFEIHKTPNDFGEREGYWLGGPDPLPTKVYLKVEYGQSIIKVIGCYKKTDDPGNYSDPKRKLTAKDDAYTNARYPLETIYLTNYDTTPMDIKATLRPSTNIHSDNPEIIALANKLISNAKTDMDKAKAIHDWVTHNIAYDCTKDPDYKEDTALTVLHRKKGVCLGYSILTATLCRAAGLQSRFVWGHQDKEGISHVWNEIKVGNKWIAVDTTWDAGHVTVNANRETFTPEYQTKYFNFNPDSRDSDYADITRSDRTDIR